MVISNSKQSWEIMIMNDIDYFRYTIMGDRVQWYK